MSEVLKKLGFVNLTGYFSLYGLNIKTDLDVYIKYKKLLTNPDFTNRYSLTEVLKHSIRHALQNNPQNAIASGYFRGAKDKLICNSPNSTLNLIKTSEWENILNQIGDELFRHILINCNVVQVVNGNKILICGTLRDCIEKKPRQRCISRNRIFFKDKTVLDFSAEDFIQKVSLSSSTELENFKGIFTRAEAKYRKTKIKLIYKNYNFHEQTAGTKSIKEIEYKKLVNFLFCISKKIFKEIFSFYNFRILKQKLTLLISRNRFETLSEEELVRYFKIKQFPWAKSTQSDKDEYNYAQNLTRNIIFQLFEDFYIPMISTFFYSTESCHGKLKVFYYPRMCWYKFADYHINKFIENMCDKEIREVVKDSKSHNLRCIPKKEGGRVVVNLSKSTTNKPGYTPNERMTPQYLILKDEVRYKLGNSALGYEDMYRRIYPFLNNLEEEETPFVLKLDLKKCFDNIPHKYLKKILDSLYEKDEYCVKKFTTLGFDCSSLKIGKFHKVLSSNLPSDIFYKENNLPPNFIYKDEVYTHVLDRQEILKTIHMMVFNNKIIYKNFIYTQSRGIPQGSVFSTLLCSLYLNRIDVKFFDRIIKKGRIIRFVDDYLIITPSTSEIRLLLKFLDKLRDVGLEFSTEKIEANFDLKNPEGPKIAKEIVWCGLKVISKSTNQINIKMNLKEKINRYGVSFPSISYGTNISNRMKIFFKTRTPEILFCPENSSIYQNIFDFFLLYKIRVKTLFSRAPFKNPLFYNKILNYSVEQMILLCRRRHIRGSSKLIVDISKSAFSDQKPAN